MLMSPCRFLLSCLWACMNFTVNLGLSSVTSAFNGRETTFKMHRNAGESESKTAGKTKKNVINLPQTSGFPKICGSSLLRCFHHSVRAQHRRTSCRTLLAPPSASCCRKFTVGEDNDIKLWPAGPNRPENESNPVQGWIRQVWKWHWL